MASPLVFGAIVSRVDLALAWSVVAGVAAAAAFAFLILERRERRKDRVGRDAPRLA
jgi:hypothetical protein